MRKLNVLLLVLCIVLCLGVLLVSCDDEGGVVDGCNHEYGEEQVIRNATCYEEGVAQKTCKLCQGSIEVPIKMAEHDYEVIDESLQTCIYDGYRNSICRACGASNNELLSAPGHSYAVNVINQPTETTEGTLEYACKNDNCLSSGHAAMPSLTNSAYTKQVIDADNADYTYTYEGITVKFTVSNFVVYPAWIYGDAPFEFTAYRIDGYKGTNKNITLPSTWNGGPVIEISELAFQNCESIETVTIPNVSFSYTIDDVKEEHREEFLAEMGEGDADGKYYLDCYTEISSRAFEDCTSLTSVTLPDTIVRIGDGAFRGCNLLESINLSSVSRIGVYAFEDCGQLKSIDISCATYIGEYAFFNCNVLESVKLGNSLETIDSYAFKNCFALTEIVIPNSVENVGSAILDNCTGLKKLTISKLYWGGKLASLFSGYLDGSFESGSYYDIDTIDVPALDCVTVTEQTEIPDSAFEGCDKIKKVVFPSNTESIGNRAFYGCYALVDFKIPDSVKSIANNAFGDIDNLDFFSQDFDNKTYYIESETNQYFYLIRVDSTASRTEVTIQDGCKFVAYDAFGSCDNVTKINIPSSVEYLGTIRYATGHATDSELSIYYNGTVERFTELEMICGGWNNFYLYVPDGQNGWSEVTEIIFSENLTEIKGSAIPAYGRFVNVTSVRIPAGIKKIGTSVFRQLTEGCITSVYYEGTIADWCNIEFTNDNSNPMNSSSKLYIANGNSWSEVTEIALPDGTKEIKPYTLKGFSGVTRLIVPDSVESISYSAYKDCADLVAIYYEGTQEQWDDILVGGSTSDTVTKYFYTETQPSLEDYIDGKDLTLWHYNNSEVELWSAKRGTTVNGKAYTYTSSNAVVTDEYWSMILALKEQNMVDAVEDPDLIEMINRSSTKAEFEAELAAYYAKSGDGLKLTFTNGTMLLEQSSESTTLEYLELDGTIYYVLTGGVGFTICEDGNALKEEIVTEYYTITHNYSIVNE